MSGEKSGVQAAVELLEKDGTFVFGQEGGQFDLALGEISTFSGAVGDFDINRKPGRPKGSKNKRTQELAKFIKKKHGHPIIALAQIAFTPTVELAQQLKIKVVDAFDRQVAILEKLGEYTDQKMPRAIEVQGEGLIQFILGVTPDRAEDIAKQGDGSRIIEMEPIKNFEEEKG